MDLLNSNRETCRQRERQAAVRRDILATMSTDNDRETVRQGKSLCSFVSDLRSVYGGIGDRPLFPQRTHVLDTQIMMHSIAHKHLWPPCLQSSPGISWDWVRKENLSSLPLLWLHFDIPPAIHSSAMSPFTLQPWLHQHPPLLFKPIYLNTNFSFFTGTKRRQTRSYFLLSTVPSPLTLPFLSVPSHTITKYQALPSPISCMLGELRPRNKGTQSDDVGATVCQSHLHSTVIQPESFKWSSERESCCQGLVLTKTSEGRHKACVLLVNTEKAQRLKSGAFIWVHKEWMYGGDVQRQLAKRSKPVVLFTSH